MIFKYIHRPKGKFIKCKHIYYEGKNTNENFLENKIALNLKSSTTYQGFAISTIENMI